MKDHFSKTIHWNEWTLRVRQPAGEGPFPIMLMLHGLTGDENAMGVFASRLPAEYLLVAPRAPFSLTTGGYSWMDTRRGIWPEIKDFQFAVDGLSKLLTREVLPEGDFSQIRLVGFSQGAALAYTFALLSSKNILAIAGLAGFAPEDAGSLAQGQPLLDVPVYIAHGTRDRIVLLERARQAQRVLQQAGAYVSFCEDDVGHKLSAQCLRNMQIFFENN